MRAHAHLLHFYKCNTCMLATTAVFTNLKIEIQKLNYLPRKHKAFKFWTTGTAGSLQANLVHAKITDILSTVNYRKSSTSTPPSRTGVHCDSMDKPAILAEPKLAPHESKTSVRVLAVLSGDS